MSEVKPPIIVRKTISDNKSLEAVIKAIVTAQRDADVAYYQPLLQQAQQEIDYIHIQQETLEDKLNDVELAIQQAKQETARELLADAEALSSGGTLHDNEGYIVLSPEAQQSLKSKFGVK